MASKITFNVNLLNPQKIFFQQTGKFSNIDVKLNVSYTFSKNMWFISYLWGCIRFKDNFLCKFIESSKNIFPTNGEIY